MPFQRSHSLEVLRRYPQAPKALPVRTPENLIPLDHLKSDSRCRLTTRASHPVTAREANLWESPVRVVLYPVPRVTQGIKSRPLHSASQRVIHELLQVEVLYKPMLSKIS